WQAMREEVLKTFPPSPGLPANSGAYLHQVDEIYASDAYNSLSIEGYKVNAQLIERVRSGNWNPDAIESDRNPRDALAARGYWQAFQSVKQSILQVLRTANAGTVADRDHTTW